MCCYGDFAGNDLANSGSQTLARYRGHPSCSNNCLKTTAFHSRGFGGVILLANVKTLVLIARRVYTNTHTHTHGNAS